MTGPSPPRADGPPAVDGAPVADGPPAVDGTPVVGSAYRRQLQHDVVRGSLWTVVAAAITLPVTFGVNLIVVRGLGAAGYGRFALYTVTFAVVLTVVNGGISDATTQWLAAARARNDGPAQLDLVRRCAGYHTFVEAPVVAVVTAVLLHGAPIGFVLLAVVANVVIQLLGTSAVVLTATARNALAARLTLASTLALQAAIAITASTEHTAAATWSVQAGVLVLSPLLAFAALSPSMRRAVLRPVVPWGWPAGFRRYALCAGAGAVVAVLVFGRSEIFVLRADGDLVAVGLFAVATALAGQITVPIDSLLGPLLPASAGLMASAPDLAHRALARGVRVSSILGMLAATIALPAAVVLLGALYGSAFDDARGALVVLGLVSCLQSVTHPVTAFALATRSAGGVLRINLACLLIDAVLAVSLIPLVGLAGAVAANAVAQLLSLGLSARLVGRRLDRPAREILLAAKAFLLAPVGAAVALLSGALVGPPALAVVTAVALGTAVAVGGLYAFPSIRLHADDARAIAVALPGPLRRAFDLLCRRGPLVAAVAAGPAAVGAAGPAAPAAPRVRP